MQRLVELGVERHGARSRRRPRRHLVLEPLSRRPLRFGERLVRLLVLATSCSRSGTGRSASPASRRTCATSTTSPTSSTFAGTCSSTARSSRRSSTRTRTLGGSTSTTGGTSPAGSSSRRSGLLSAPTLPRYEGMDSFEGQSFHTFDWPRGAGRPDRASGSRVIGTGATGIQVIGEIADKVGDLTVFQRRPNWCAPLHNGRSPRRGDGRHQDPLRRGLRPLRPHAGRLHPRARPARRSSRCRARSAWRMWEKLYDEPGFGIWLGNFRDTFMDEAANAELSEFIADKIRPRVHDPVVAEKLIPKDHGFGVQRVPLETHYYEAYNRDNVHLVDLQETPIERITADGHPDHRARLRVRHHRVRHRLRRHHRLLRPHRHPRRRRSAADGQVGATARRPISACRIHGFPNLLMPTGPQGGSASTNYPRGIETGRRLVHRPARVHGQGLRARRPRRPRSEWAAHVAKMYAMMLMRKAQAWFTGYNSNVDGPREGHHPLPRLQRRHAQVRGGDHRGGRKGL